MEGSFVTCEDARLVLIVSVPRVPLVDASRLEHLLSVRLGFC